MRFEPDKKLHSREHVLAQDLSEMLGESKKFAAYLGIARRYYERDLRALARMVKEKSDLPLSARGKYFFACLRSLAPTSEFLARLRASRRARVAQKKKLKHARSKSKHSANRKKTSSRAPTKSA